MPTFDFASQVWFCSGEVQCQHPVPNKIKWIQKIERMQHLTQDQGALDACIASSGTLSTVGVSILPQIGCLPLRNFLEGKGTLSVVEKISPMQLTTFLPSSRRKKIGHLRDGA